MPDAARFDHRLHDVVSLVAGTDLEVPLTLHVRGAVVSGLLVGPTKWAEATTQGQPPELAAAWGQRWKTEVERFEEARGRALDRLTSAVDADVPEDELKSLAEAIPEHAFLHLLRARTFFGVLPIANEGAPWRGRLDSVDGWSFGELVQAAT